jgi:DNA-binding beta-propeller fold protein YncE
MEVSEDGKTLWATLRWIKKVAVVDIPSRKVIKLIPVGRSPHGVYFANRAGDNKAALLAAALGSQFSLLLRLRQRLPPATV